MAEVVERVRIEEIVGKYRVSHEFAEDLRTAFAAAKKDPERAQRIYDLISGLPEKTAAQRRASVREVLELLARPSG